jgi:hypothetical protein
MAESVDFTAFDNAKELIHKLAEIERAGGKVDGNCVQLLPEQYQRAIAAAEQRGYLKALDKVLSLLRKNYPGDFDVMDGYKDILNLKSDYLRQEGKNGD